MTVKFGLHWSRVVQLQFVQSSARHSDLLVVYVRKCANTRLFKLPIDVVIERIVPGMDVNNGTPSLLGLHPDLLVKVLLQLEPRDLQSVSCSCKALALTDSPLWQALFFHKWDVPRGSHLNYKKLYFRREQLLIYLESVCSRLKPQEEPSLQTLHDGRRVVGAGRFAVLSPRTIWLSSNL